MSTILLTLTLAFIGVLCALALLGIGWLITGKSKIKAGACGRDPTKNRDENCNESPTLSCGLCKKKELK